MQISIETILGIAYYALGVINYLLKIRSELKAIEGESEMAPKDKSRE